MKTRNGEQDPEIGEVWRTYMTTGSPPKDISHPWFESPQLRPLVRRLPSDPRCRLCLYPFEGVGGALSRRLLGIEPSRMNPHMCNICERFAEAHPGGTEMEVSLLFADIRGSTSMAEKMSATEFSRLIDRFYQTATSIIFDHGGMLEKFAGDAVVGFFTPGFAGENHPQAAVDTAKDILGATGHGTGGAPWIPIGVGVHTGQAYIGTVGEKGKNLDIAVLGDNVNTAARLMGAAQTGELVISDTSLHKAGLDSAGMTFHSFELKGKENPVDAWVYHTG